MRRVARCQPTLLVTRPNSSSPLNSLVSSVSPASHEIAIDVEGIRYLVSIFSWSLSSGEEQWELRNVSG